MESHIDGAIIFYECLTLSEMLFATAFERKSRALLLNLNFRMRGHGRGQVGTQKYVPQELFRYVERKKDPIRNYAKLLINKKKLFSKTI